jgi:double-strand break repair protein AddB
MFDPTSNPRVFGLPPGVDFATALVQGLVDRSADVGPQQLAKARVFVNTARMQRRLRDVFDQGPARLLPRVQLVTDLALEPMAQHLAAPISPLRRRLELSKFVAALLTQEPDLAPRAALYDLSDSLANLMDEMQGEGVPPSVLQALDISDQSGHWDRALRFLSIIAPYFDRGETAPDKEARQRQVIEALDAAWSATPPADPIIVAGSTGSRGATALFMNAVAKMPQGAVILPGYDFDLPQPVWDAMDGAKGGEDHPQFRFRKFMDLAGISPQDIQPWTDTQPMSPERNALVSLALRPAPVTDQWLRDGPGLGDLKTATEAITLLEAPSPRAEAEAIALRLRQAVDDGITAALITPDRMLTRQVASALDRWDITPDDSAGTPLTLSPPGRFLRHILDLVTRPLTSEALLVILKHPLSYTGSENRGPHLLNTRLLELYVRRKSIPFPTAETLANWAATQDETKHDWALWVGAMLDRASPISEAGLQDQLAHVLKLAEAFAAGRDAGEGNTGTLWDETAGREAKRVCETLQRDADAAGTLAPHDFAALFSNVLSQGVVRERDKGHPQVLIWGTLEARVQGADLTILGGMNEGVWPEAPAPDPWLNRAMRAKAGLLLPERRIGLSAHDFQQAVAGRAVWITRSKRSADAETVPSRWVNRLLNLLNGLPQQGGTEAVNAMRARGGDWLATAEALSRPQQAVAPSPRPSPQPPIAARPRKLSVTQIKTLIRDPYAIYAREVLRLKPLDLLTPQAEASLRGVILHTVLERFVAEKCDPTTAAAHQKLRDIAEQEFTTQCPWPTMRALWLAQFDNIIDPFLAGEAARQTKGDLGATEAWGEMHMPSVDVTVTCKADRFDLTDAGAALIYDYKTGLVPSVAVQKKFDKQLLVEAVMVEKGAFESLGIRNVELAEFVAVNTGMRDVAAPLATLTTAQIWVELEQHLQYWQKPENGYTARRALQSRIDQSDYDHLARFGEWKLGDPAKSEVLT